MKVGAIMACIWGAALAFVLANGWYDSIDLERPLQLLFLLGSLTIVAVGIPASRDAEMRNPGSLFFLALGAVLVGMAAALVALILFTVLMSGWNSEGRN